MDDTEPAEVCKLKEGLAAPIAAIAAAPAAVTVISFDRNELREIFNLYGRKVAGGEWRDYGIEKTPRLARKQGAYSVVTATGLVLKRGHDLRPVIAALDTWLKLVSEGTGGDASFA